jgi:hypothetical protein
VINDGKGSHFGQLAEARERWSYALAVVCPFVSITGTRAEDDSVIDGEKATHVQTLNYENFRRDIRRYPLCNLGSY